MSRRNKENEPYKSSNNKSVKNRINEQGEQIMLRKFGTRRNKQIRNEADYPNSYISGPVPSIDENIFNADTDDVVDDAVVPDADAVVADAHEIAVVNTETAPLDEDFALGLDDDEELLGGKRRKRSGGASRKRKGRKSKKGKKSRKGRKSRKSKKNKKSRKVRKVRKSRK
jgi:hypothetical protein